MAANQHSIQQARPPTRRTHQKTTGKPCINCGGTLRYGGSYGCVVCTNRRSMAGKQTATYKKQAKLYWMQKRYGMNPEKMAQLFAQQGHKCACCGTKEAKAKRGWVIDHCHKTGVVRGVLCDACNVGLGRFGDCIEKLHAAIAYLQRANNAA